MTEETGAGLPNLVTLAAGALHGTPLAAALIHWEPVIFSGIIIAAISVVAWSSARRGALIPGRLQSAGELIVSGFDDFVCGIVGPRGRPLVPFIGTLFVYILAMNLSGLIPFVTPPTSSWSTTLALALCVFAYLQFTAVRELGIWGYIDHLAERPRGILAFSVVIPVMLFFLHVISEFIRPVSLSLRLRSNIWGDEMLLSVLYGFGLPALPLILFNVFLAILAAVVQAGVFCLLTTIYFTLVLSHEE